MVDKVDRPEAPRTWAIKETAASQDRGQEQERDQGQSRGGDSVQVDDEFSSPGSPSEWHKFYSSEGTREFLHINRSQIKHFWFHKAILQRQTALMEGHVELMNGTRYEHAQILLPRFDDYFQIKNYIPGQEVPIFTIIHEQRVDISVPITKTVAPRPRRTRSTAAKQSTAQSIQWRRPISRRAVVISYCIIIGLVISYILSEI